MAEIAIPMVALGAMWLISNDKKKSQLHKKDLIMYQDLINKN